MYRAPRGTADILPDEQPFWRYVESTAAELCEQFGYRRIDTPSFESSSLFLRSVGEATDVVEKETYTFDDRSGDSMTLRPEGTAAVCRAYLEHGMHVQPQPVRLYSVRAPMFRYDRPQAGRYRQHHQASVEAIGDADAAVDAEIIELAWSIFSKLGLNDLTLLVNSIGDQVCRPGYLDVLRHYYQPHQDHLCADCKRRFQSNPLRLLDCNKESCQPYTIEAPRTVDHLCAECKEHWDQLTGYLDSLSLPYSVDHRLVRGFDYYTRTVFEVQPPVEGSQSAIGGGGRYDGLIQELGGRATPAVGFASGMERLILNLKRQGVGPPSADPGPLAMVAFVGDAARNAAVKLAASLRGKGLPIMLAPPGKSLKAQMRHAGALNARHTVILGEEELTQDVATVRDMATGKQRQVPMTGVAEALRPS